MATKDQIIQLRRMTGYDAVDPYDDAALSAMIDATSLNRVANRLWTERATELAALVNVSESGSSRSMGDLHKNALTMAKHFEALAAAEVVTPVEERRVSRTRAIVRETAE